MWKVSRRDFLRYIRNLVMVGGGVLAYGFRLPAVWAPVKIAPTRAAPPHPFELIDTPEGRLVDGTVAVFDLNGVKSEIPLRTHSPYKTAHGDLPANLPGGDYLVSFKTPSGEEFEVGPFKVIGPPPEPTVPTIEPTSGPVGTLITITDPQGRLTGADRIMFTQPGNPFETGTPAGEFQFVSATEVKGKVPQADEVPHDVTVHAGDPTLNEPLIDVLGFEITLG